MVELNVREDCKPNLVATISTSFHSPLSHIYIYIPMNEEQEKVDEI
jgi:hypothetical protein